MGNERKDAGDSWAQTLRVLWKDCKSLFHIFFFFFNQNIIHFVSKHVPLLCLPCLPDYRSAGKLLVDKLEECQRCWRCRRRTTNWGETSVWKDSCYPSGSQFMIWSRTRKTLTNSTSCCCIAAQRNMHYFNCSWSLFHNYHTQFVSALCALFIFLVVLNSGNSFQRSVMSVSTE